MRRLGLALGSILVAAACGPSSQPPPRILDADPAPTEDGHAPGVAQTELDRGVAYLEKEAWDEARPHLEAASKAQPKNAEARYYLAVVDSRQGRKAEAQRGFEEALDLDPGLTLARAHLAEIYLTSDPIAAKEAIEVLGPAVKAEPEAPDLHQLLGFAYRVDKDYDASAKHYRASLSAKDDAQVRFDFADMLFEARRFEDSAIQMRKLVPQFKDDKVVMAQLAHRFAKAKAFDDCVTAFTQAITLDDEEPGFYLHRGLCKHALNQEPQARADYEKAIAVDPKFQPAYYYMGMSWLEDGKRTRAIQMLEQAWKIDGASKVGKAARAKLDQAKRR